MTTHREAHCKVCGTYLGTNIKTEFCRVHVEKILLPTVQETVIVFDEVDE